MKIKKILVDIWSNAIGGVIAVIIVASGTYLLGYWKYIPDLMSAIGGILNYQLPIPLWILILASCLLIVLSIPVIRTLFIKPDFTDYTHDIIFEVDWYWDWYVTGKKRKQYSITNLNARCPDCQSLLEVSNYHYRIMYCQNNQCIWEWPERYRGGGSYRGEIRDGTDLIDKVKNEIERKVHTEEWKE